MAAQIPPRVRRTTAAILAVVTLAVLVGATYQGVATALERRRFQRPGGLVDAGGHQLHIHCTGEGAPVVVLEAAAGSMSSAWSRVQPRIAAVTRVCSYDRSGLGWSETGDGLYDPGRVSAELHALLAEAHEPAPFVLVGHELGASYARLFAARFPGVTAAVIGVAAPEDAGGVDRGPWVSAWPWLARTGLLRASGGLSARAGGLPGEAGGAMTAFLNRPDHLTRAAQEIARAREVDTMARAAVLAPAVLTATVTVARAAPPAVLADPDEAARVAAAVDTMVDRVREATATAAHAR